MNVYLNVYLNVYSIHHPSQKQLSKAQPVDLGTRWAPRCHASQQWGTVEAEEVQNKDRRSHLRHGTRQQEWIKQHIVQDQPKALVVWWMAGGYFAGCFSPFQPPSRSHVANLSMLNLRRLEGFLRNPNAKSSSIFTPPRNGILPMAANEQMGGGKPRRTRLRTNKADSGCWRSKADGTDLSHGSHGTCELGMVSMDFIGFQWPIKLQ